MSDAVSPNAHDLRALAHIDWTRPWFAPYAAVGQPLAHAALQREERPGAVAWALNQALSRTNVVLPAGRLRAISQCELPNGTAYEAHIAATACLPTRDNLHDFFNGLMWLHWPVLKARLNALQAAEILRLGIGQQRGPARDALTLFDENGALWCGPADWLTAWRERRWADWLWAPRTQWHDRAGFILMGHALMEQLVLAPRKGLTAHVLAWPLPDTVPTTHATPPWRGESLAAQALPLQAPDWATKPFLPLPVAGIPGWWPDQEDQRFYTADAAVFRVKR